MLGEAPPENAAAVNAVVMLTPEDVNWLQVALPYVASASDTAPLTGLPEADESTSL
jgi:hypothetical protein